MSRRGSHPSPRVLLITNQLPPVRGGSAVVYDSLARRSGGRIMVLAPRRRYEDGFPAIGWREHDLHAPYKVVRLDLLRTALQQHRTKLGRLLSDAFIRARLMAVIAYWIGLGDVSAICVGELTASGWILKLCRLLPWVTRAVYIHGEEITRAGPYDPGLKRRKKALRAAHQIIVVSRFTAAAVAELTGDGGRGRIRLIENGVDTDRFQPRPRDQELVARYDLADRFLFVSVCRLLKKKGIDNALLAFATVRQQYPDSRFLVVGGGPYRPELERLVAERNLVPEVIFAGVVPDSELVAHYALGDVFVMPNRRMPDGDTEGFGLVFLEANAVGLPVIAGKDGGSTDAVQDEVNGLVVDGHSVEEIAAAMLRLLRDVPLREQLRRNGLQIAHAADWRSKAHSFLDLFAAG
ncbi:MAG TPA: glycosyltransferase family 4 protein [Acetobacteraceae bacterium]|nr:glycosyltransferase family 4 protein [Acetobacteraceae bacterium]